jgi:pimeloyl-ACP methyl ester carboxylesterase
MSAGVTRRSVLAALVAAPALPLLVACGASPEATAGVDLASGTLSSRFWPGQKVRWRLAQPTHRGSAKASRPLVVALHGHGGDADWPFNGVHIGRHIASTGLSVATIDGGDFYWHARRSGVDTGRMITQDVLPLLAGRGVNTDRIALIGWSMGGYGALLLAGRLGPRRVAAVAAVSAALWQSPGDSAAGAFDNRADFAANDVFAARAKLSGIPVRLDCGRDDPFIVANRTFARELPAAVATFDDGSHTEEYWSAHAGADMRWLRTRFQSPLLR